MKVTLNQSLIFIALFILFGCQSYHSKKGVKYFQQEDYASAIFHFQKANEIENYFENDVKIAEAYFQMDQLDSSERYYYRAYRNGVNVSKSYLPYAKVLFANLNYKEATHLLEANALESHSNAEAEMLLNICHSIHVQDSHQRINHSRIKEKDVNAFSLKDYRNGTAFLPEKNVFNGKPSDEWTQTTYLNLLKNDQRTIQGEWINRDLITQDKYNRFFDGSAAYSQDGKTVHFTRSDYSKNDSLEKRMKVFSASYKDGRWENLQEFQFNNDAYSVGHVALSPNDETLYFASDMPGGFGGLDVYSCRKENGKWSIPENLGAAINSPKNECFPYVDADNSLFYASDQVNEFGKLDVFITYFNGERWMKPETINHTLTAASKDLGDRFDPNNLEKILTITNREPRTIPFKLTGRAVNKQTQAPIQGALMQLTTGKTGELIQIYSDANGYFNFDLEKGIDYVIFLKNKNSFTKTTSFSTKSTTAATDFFVDYQVEVIELNQPYPIGAIDYASEHWELTPPLKNELDKLLQLLLYTPSITLEITAHTDISGAANYTKILTEKRSHTVVEYLISQGVLPTRLTFKGYGEENILNKCTSEEIPCTELEKAANRRIEYTVVSY